ncbi:MAG: mechanosensitive ion channel domain-containing protein [Dokdonella sp.]
MMERLRELWAVVESVIGFKLFTLRGGDFLIANLLGVLLTIVAVWLVAKIIRRSLRRFGDAYPSRSRANIYTLSRIAQYIVLAVGAMLVLDVAGIPLSQFAVFAGALGVGLGFGLQSIFNNFVCGLILLFDRSLKVGDYVELASGIHGEVRDIHIRATRVTTNDDIDILVPNSEFVNGRVTNWTLNEPTRRIKVPFQVAYGSDKDAVRRAGVEAANSVPFTTAVSERRAPQVWLTSFDESGISFALVVWLGSEAIGRHGAVMAAYNWELESALARHGVSMPFPQRDLHVRSWFGLTGSAAIQAARHGLDEDHEAPVVEVKPGAPKASSASNDAARDIELDAIEDAQEKAEEEAEEKWAALRNPPE